MSDLTFNKVAGALLATGLAIVGLRQLASGVFSEPEVAKPGYTVDISAETAGAGATEVADVPPDWGTVLPKADVAAGQADFAKCQSCHTLGANATGPNLVGVVGRKPGTEAGFSYSSAMQGFGAKQPVWDYDHLYEFLKGPQAYINGTKMTFVGLKKPEDRINVIAFLRSQGGTLPIPAPNPKAAEAAKSPAPTAATGGGVVGSAKAPGAAPAGQAVATGSTAKPATGAGGPTGNGPGAPSQQPESTSGGQKGKS